MPALKRAEKMEDSDSMNAGASVPTILAVDDDQVDRMSIQRMLKKIGYRVILASSAEEGLEQFAENDVDCVLLDYFMPGTHGVAVLQSIRKINEHTPVIMITGQGDEMIAVDAMKHGAVDYLPKDELNPDMLKAIIDRSIEHTQMLKQIHSQKFQLENYAHVLAHEVKEPLRTIRAHLRVVLSQSSQEMSDVARDHLRQVSELLTNLETLVDAALSGAKSGKEGQEERQSAKLVFILRRALDNLEKNLLERKLEVSSHNLPNIHLPLNFIQFFHALCKLYVDFSNAGSIQIVAQESNDGWIFAVGPDAPPPTNVTPKNNLASLLETLESRDRKNAIGLHVCKTFIDSQGGKIWCDTGTHLNLIYFKLPKAVVVS